MKKGLALALLLLLATASAAWAQCPMCRTALQSPQAAALAAAFRHGILLLLAAPFLSIGIVAWLVVRSQRRGPLLKPSPPAPLPAAHPDPRERGG